MSLLCLAPEIYLLLIFSTAHSQFKHLGYPNHRCKRAAGIGAWLRGRKHEKQHQHPHDAYTRRRDMPTYTQHEQA